MDPQNTLLEMLESRRDHIKQEAAENAIAIEQLTKRILIDTFGPRHIKDNHLIITFGSIYFQVYRIHNQWTAELETHKVWAAHSPDPRMAVDVLLSSIHNIHVDLVLALEFLLRPPTSGSMLGDPK
jgi:hypothetical protein